MEQGHLVIDVVDGVLQQEVLASGLRFGTAHRGDSRLQIRLCGIESRFFNGDCVLEGLLVQLGKNISLVDTVVVINQYPGTCPPTRAATNVTWPLTKASSVEAVLSVSRIQGMPNTEAPARTKTPSTPSSNLRLCVERRSPGSADLEARSASANFAPCSTDTPSFAPRSTETSPRSVERLSIDLDLARVAFCFSFISMRVTSTRN